MNKSSPQRKSYVYHDVLEAIDQAPIGTQSHLFHYIFQGDEVFDVQIWFVGEIFCCRIKVDVEA